jgi:hypothetical protein
MSDDRSEPKPTPPQKALEELEQRSYNAVHVEQQGDKPPISAMDAVSMPVPPWQPPPAESQSDPK